MHVVAPFTTPGQTTPQCPQFAGSVAVFVHVPLHIIEGGAHASPRTSMGGGVSMTSGGAVSVGAITSGPASIPTSAGASTLAS
jgi:hypothetical protein